MEYLWNRQWGVRPSIDRSRGGRKSGRKGASRWLEMRVPRNGGSFQCHSKSRRSWRLPCSVQGSTKRDLKRGSQAKRRPTVSPWFSCRAALENFDEGRVCIGLSLSLSLYVTPESDLNFPIYAIGVRAGEALIDHLRFQREMSPFIKWCGETSGFSYYIGEAEKLAGTHLLYSRALLSRTSSAKL